MRFASYKILATALTLGAALSGTSHAETSFDQCYIRHLNCTKFQGACMPRLDGQEAVIQNLKDIYAASNSNQENVAFIVCGSWNPGKKVTQWAWKSVDSVAELKSTFDLYSKHWFVVPNGTMVKAGPFSIDQMKNKQTNGIEITGDTRVWSRTMGKKDYVKARNVDEIYLGVINASTDDTGGIL